MEAVTSVLDAPCGDFNWQQDLDFGGQYLGLEIVPELVDANCAEYASDHRQFRLADIVHDTLPGADLVLCRECLNHLPLADADRAIEHLVAAAGRLVASSLPEDISIIPHSARYYTKCAECSKLFRVVLLRAWCATLAGR